MSFFKPALSILLLANRPEEQSVPFDEVQDVNFFSIRLISSCNKHLRKHSFYIYIHTHIYIYSLCTLLCVPGEYLCEKHCCQYDPLIFFIPVLPFLTEITCGFCSFCSQNFLPKFTATHKIV